MLPLPSKGVRRSVTAHNCRIDVLVDWIEGSALFEETRISRSDVSDALCEHEVYRSQDFASAFVADLWTELRRRIERSGLTALSMDANGVEATRPWKEFSAHTFCLVLALRDWYSRTDKTYIEQGELFEKLTERSLLARGWRLLRTGWSSTKANKLKATVETISVHLAEPTSGGIGRWTKPHAKDAGLDLICDRPFSDGRGGRPLYFVQCASGADWRGKLRTPNLRLWDKLIDFSNGPVHGFAIPYVLSDDDFRHTANSVNGMVLDRLRLVGLPNEVGDWITSELSAALNAWSSPRIDDLQQA